MTKKPLKPHRPMTSPRPLLQFSKMPSQNDFFAGRGFRTQYLQTHWMWISLTRRSLPECPAKADLADRSTLLTLRTTSKTSSCRHGLSIYSLCKRLRSRTFQARLSEFRCSSSSSRSGHGNRYSSCPMNAHCRWDSAGQCILAII